MIKVGFLFGAGAEISYGMPTGGKFALDIFRRDVTGAKETFKENRTRIMPGSSYASNWLPMNYATKKVGAYGSSVYESIISDTISNNRTFIVEKINAFDEITRAVLSNLSQNVEDLRQQFTDDFNISYTEVNVNQRLSYNNFLSEGNSLFESNCFAILLHYYQNYQEFDDRAKKILGNILKSIFQLHIGALSEQLSRNLQENIFSHDDMGLDFFDDLGGILAVNYQSAGVKGLELLSDIDIVDNDHLIVKLAFGILEQIYIDVLDYKTIIDSNWHYLYTPKTEWAKFCKISVFLHSVREYITQEFSYGDDNSGYYDDLSASTGIDLATVGTTNYVNNLIEDRLSIDNIVFLNGSINEYYDPYMNSILTKEEFEQSNRFAVPMIFTQSGTKPMTSIDMSMKYVNYFNELKGADFICSIGFGFNIDDEHINGIFRTLIEREGKKLVVIDIHGIEDEESYKERLTQKLKVINRNNIFIVYVNNDREVGGVKWTEYLKSDNFLSIIGVRNGN